MPPPAPKCTTCGYDLSGIPLEGLCPECGAQTPPRPFDAYVREEAYEIMQLNLTGLLGAITCFGPLAAVFAFITLRRARTVLILVRAGDASWDAARGVVFSMLCSGLVLVLCALEVLVLLAALSAF